MRRALINNIPHRACMRRAWPLLDMPHPGNLLAPLTGLPAPSATEQAGSARAAYTRPQGSGLCLGQLRPTRDIADRAHAVPCTRPPLTPIGLELSLRGWSVMWSSCLSICAGSGAGLGPRGASPYDTVFIINQFLNAVMQRGKLSAGGEPNQVLGDAGDCWALFGMGDQPDVACRQAIASPARRDRSQGRRASTARWVMRWSSRSASASASTRGGW